MAADGNMWPSRPVFTIDHEMAARARSAPLDKAENNATRRTTCHGKSRRAPEMVTCPRKGNRAKRGMENLRILEQPVRWADIEIPPFDV